MKKFLLGIFLLGASLSLYGCTNVVATVNGQAITQKQLDTELEKVNGRPMLDNLISRTLVEQDAKNKHVTVTEQEIDRQLEEVKKTLAPVDQQSLAGDKLQTLKDQISFNLLLQKTIISSVPETEIKAYYEKNKDVLPEVEISAILVANQKQAQAILDELHRGREFASLAGQFSLDPGGRDRGGYVGYVSEGNLEQLSPDLAKAAFHLKAGQVSPIIKTQKGFYILKILNTRSTFDELKEEIEKQMAADRLKTYIQNLHDTAKINYKGAFAKQ